MAHQNQSLRRMLQMSLQQLSVPDSMFRTGGGRGSILYPSLTSRASQSWLSRNSVRPISTTVAARKMDKIDLSNFIGDRNSLGFGDSVHGKFEKVSPQTVSPRRPVPDSIITPDYYLRPDGVPRKWISWKINTKSPEEQRIMRETCKLARYILECTLAQAKPGVTTDALDKYAHELIIKNNAFPSALNYRKFPKSICTSVNNVACHGIPDSRKLISGDILTVDLMVYKNGFHGDCAATELIGDVDKAGQNLVDVAEECLMAGINECGPGKSFGNIGKAIEKHASSFGYSVIHGFTGHGIGKNIHEKPDVYHYDRPDCSSDIMMPGMTFTVEPVITQGMDLFMILSDGWTAVTVDGARAAQFEHTILITESGIEILTEDE